MKTEYERSAKRGLLHMTEQQSPEPIDLTIEYDFRQYPDKQSGRCDNCNQAIFKSSVNNGKFLRECRNCGMKKLI